MDYVYNMCILEIDTYTDGPQLRVVQLIFFNFMMVPKGYTFSRNGPLNVEFQSFPGLVISSTALFHDAGKWPWDHRVEATHWQPFCFLLLV